MDDILTIMPNKTSANNFLETLRGGTFFLGGGGLGPQSGGSSVKVSTKRGGPYLM